MVSPHQHPDKTVASPVWEDLWPNSFPVLAAPYDLPVGWYLWVVAIVLVLALMAFGAILVQRRWRSRSVLSVRPRRNGRSYAVVVEEVPRGEAAPGGP